MKAPRPSSESPFPYGYPGAVCYFVIDGAGVVVQLHTREDIRLAVAHSIKEGHSYIYAAWPGQYRTELFHIDDLIALAKAVKAPIFADASETA